MAEPPEVPETSADLLASELERSGGTVERSETHVSTVLFHDGWAYKVKRAVRFEFVDLSTVELRKELCERELVLNQRFTTGVYDSVVPIRNSRSEIVDHALKMRRMPDDRRLATLGRNTDPGVHDCVRRIARAVASIHSEAPRSSGIYETGRPDFVLSLWRRTIDDIERFTPDIVPRQVLDEIDHRSMRYIAGRTPLFTERIRARHIVDGHGDLLADDIFCMPDGPKILDCLEFDDLLRFGDVLLDVAFLAMDLERIGRGDLAGEFVNEYVEFSGEHHPRSMLHFYVAYRALVRAKIACLKSSEHPEYRERAASLCERSLSHLRRASPTLTIVGGLPASGKSTLAALVADGQNALLLRTDVIRKELTGLAGQAAQSPFNTGIYTSETTAATYDETFRRARVALGMGESVVVDASFSTQAQRLLANGVAGDTSSELREFLCRCPDGVRERRLLDRKHDGTEPSDATVAISREMERIADAWPTAVAIDTDQSIDASIAALRNSGPLSGPDSVVWIRTMFDPVKPA